MSALARISSFIAAIWTLSCLATLPAFAAPKTIPGELLVRFKSDVGPAERATLRAQMKGKALGHFKSINVEHLKLEAGKVEDVIERFKRHPRIEYVEPNYEIQLSVTPNDARFPELYGMRNTGQTGGTAGADIKATNAWDVFTGNPNLLVGVIDTGIDYNHPDLIDNVWTNPGEIPGNSIDDDSNGYVDDVHGYDFVNSDGDPFDDNGHGSHCAGTIAGTGNNSIGVVGVNWRAKIAGIKFLNASGSGSTANAIAGVQYAIVIGCKLTSNSWGGGGFSQALLDAINAAGAANQLFVAAAGNATTNIDTSPSYPAAYNSPYIVSVAATDHNDNLASFSNYGATNVDLAAPGVNILSLQPGGGYRLLSGTSMATPHVAGGVALAMGRFPLAGNLQIKQLLLNAVDVKPQLAGKCLTGGRMNVFMAIADPDDTPPGAVADLATADPGSNTMGLAWTATGDDGNVGRASSYEIRYSLSPITDLASFQAGTLVASPDPQPVGSSESATAAGLAFNTTYYFALRAKDEFGNAGPISNVATGTTLGIPNIATSPGSFTADLLTGGTSVQTLTLSNNAAGTLDFTIPTPELEFTQPAPFEPTYVPKGEDWRIGDPVADGEGGPDGFGYRWKDSNEPGGPAFSWVDISAVGTQIPLTVDDGFSASISMGMSFPFYGGAFGSLRVHTNGFLSFTETTGAFDGNQPLPTSGAAANLVAPFWDDLDFRTTYAPNARAYYHFDGTRFIVSWINVPGYRSATGNPIPGPYSFQAILYPTGEVLYQYLSIGSPSNSATVGIQNATKTVGLNVAFNTAYVQNNLAVRIAPLRQWLRVTPTAGRIHAGQSMNLQVTMDATGLDGGGYDGAVQILSNDPDGPASVPAHINVTGAPDVAVNPTSLAFGTVFVGASPTRTLTVSNPGTAPLHVANVVGSDPTVTANPTSFTLAPRAAQNVIVTYSPTTPAVLNATLALESDDPDTPSLLVPVTGEGVPPPAVSVNPTSLSSSLYTGNTEVQQLTLANAGGANLVWSLVLEVLTQTASYTLDAPLAPSGSDEDGGQPSTQFDPDPFQAQLADLTGVDVLYDRSNGQSTTSLWTTIVADLTTRGATVTQSTAALTPALLAGYEVLWLTDPSSTATWDAAELAAVVNWMNGGGGVLLEGDNTNSVTWYNQLLTTLSSGIQYSQTDNANGTSANIHPHATTAGVTGIFLTAATASIGTIVAPAGRLVDDINGLPNTAFSLVGAGKVVAAADELFQNSRMGTASNRLFGNQVFDWLAAPSFLLVTPTAGTVPPGGNQVLNATFDATGLFGGLYQANIKFTTNDPLASAITVPASLQVTGAPNLQAEPASLDFGIAYLGFPQLRQISVQNTGTDVLHVSNIAFNEAAYGVDQTTFSVPPLGNALLFVSFNPTSVGSQPATMTIVSNDPDTPNLAVPLTGTGLVAPDVRPDPTSLSATITVPGSDTRTLTLHNEGGSDLNFVVGTQLTASAVTVYEGLDLGKEEVDPRQGIQGSGGPDLFGYRWRDNDDPGGPMFDWVDITGIGTPITFATGDDANSQGHPIGFDFPFYGNTFNTVNICTNGWISFTATQTSFNNQPLPTNASSTAPNMIAAFWDDLNPGTATPRVYRYSDGTRFIVSYVGVPRLTSGGPYTFQIILYPSGRIVYQYLDMQGTRLNEATVGIQNATKTDGLTVVFNNPYVHNGLAVEIATIPEYLTVNPTTGTIPAGGSANVVATFNTNGLFGGTYDGALRITSNDPDEPVVTVPTQLTAVGVPDIAAVPPSLNFGPVYIGLTKDLPISIRSVGSDALNVTGVTFDNPDFTLVSPPAFPVTLGNNGALALTVRYTPTTACAPCTGNMNVASNDPDQPTLAVALAGNGVVPPEIEVSPASLKAALATTLGPTAIQKTKKVAIANTGGSDLNWTASAFEVSASATQVHDFLALDKAEDVAGSQEGVDPRPGILGSGGPDAFGYTWKDSDAPGGPTFQWVDISAIGTPTGFPGYVLDDNVGPYPIGFDFPFYGNTFTQFWVCDNGWISFTNGTLQTFTNQPLPNSGSASPENMLAVWWDDMVFDPDDNVYVKYHNDGTRLIVEYFIRRIGDFTPPHYNFQIILYPNGDIVYQYKFFDTNVTSATIGIQNGAKNDGLTVVHNAAYVHPNLAIKFSSRPSWLSVSPFAGVVEAGAAPDTVEVTFNATELEDGDYSGMVRIASNDLDEPVTNVPASLHVGVATAGLTLDPNSLNRTSNGNSLKGTVTPPVLPPNPILPQDIAIGSLLLERQVGVVPGAPVEYENGDGIYKFARAELQDLLPEGEAVPVELIGEVTDVTWFRAVDEVRVFRPRMTTTQLVQGTRTVFHVGDQVWLDWEDPTQAVAGTFEMYFSGDGGQTWTTVVSNYTERRYRWTVPPVPTTEGILELVAVDANGPMGTWISGDIEVLSGTTAVGDVLPERFELAFAGPNPASGSARLKLALPQSAPVDVRVHDVRGGVVKTLADGELAAGIHPLHWDGRDATGRRVSAGVYFVKAETPGRTSRVRFVLLP